MSFLFDSLPNGAFLHSSMVSAADKVRLVNECRKLFKTHPLMAPTTRSGHAMKLSVTSWGKVGWFGRQGSYSYLKTHENGMPWPPVPDIVTKLLRRGLIGTDLVDDPARFEFDTVLLNFYPNDTGKLGKHRDETEEDHESPIVTISLGQMADFELGGIEYNDLPMSMTLHSGDIFVLGGESRMRYHEVVCIHGKDDLLKKGGRISLTGRKVFK